MVKVIVNLNEMDKLKNFIEKVSMFEGDIDAVRGRYVIDAKSVIGLFSVDLSKPLEVIFHSENEEEINKFLEVMKNFQ